MSGDEDRQVGKKGGWVIQGKRQASKDGEQAGKRGGWVSRNKRCSQCNLQTNPVDLAVHVAKPPYIVCSLLYCTYIVFLLLY